MPRKLKINFCSFRKRSEWSDVYGGEVPGVDEIHARFIDGIDVWIIQSYLISKTASKLTNARLAGAPAVVGEEPAYAELRKHPYDYLAVASPQEILGALGRLRQNGEYDKFRAHAKWRAQEFTREKTCRNGRRFWKKAFSPPS
jgi:hypothetical protein